MNTHPVCDHEHESIAGVRTPHPAKRSSRQQARGQQKTSDKNSPAGEPQSTTKSETYISPPPGGEINPLLSHPVLSG